MVSIPTSGRRDSDGEWFGVDCSRYDEFQSRQAGDRDCDEAISFWALTKVESFNPDKRATGIATVQTVGPGMGTRDGFNPDKRATGIATRILLAVKADRNKFQSRQAGDRDCDSVWDKVRPWLIS